MDNVMETDKRILISLLVLSFSAIFVGYFSHDILCGCGSFFWSNSLQTMPWHFSDVEFLLISPLIKVLPFIFTILGVCFALSCNYLVSQFLLKGKSFSVIKIFYFGLQKFGSYLYSAIYFNIVYNYLFELFFRVSYVNIVKNTEKGFLEQFGPYGVLKVSLLVRELVVQYAPFVIFLWLGFIFIGLNFFVLFVFLHVKLFLFFINNFGLLLISLFLFFSEYKNIKI